MLVLGVLEKDKNVLVELLTTNRYPMDYIKPDRMKTLLSGGGRYRHVRQKYGDQFEAIAKTGKWPGVDSTHVSSYNLDREKADALRRGPGEWVAFPKHQRAGMLTHPAWLVAHSGNFDNDPIRRGKWIREHLLADLVPDVPIGVDAKVPEDAHRTLRERLDIVRAAECWRCHKQMNPLGEVFESYDDFGRYRDRILIGDVDGYLKKKRKYDGQKSGWEKDLNKWLKLDAAGRTARVKEAETMLASLVKPDKKTEKYSSKKRQYEKDVKRWTNEREKWLNMDDAHQQRVITDLRRRLGELAEPTPEFKPVDARGELRGTGDPKLDGPVDGAIDLVHRLAQSERTRQSFIRHAFRYWMGRNETLDDSPTLIAADKAYVESGGSFNALLVSLLSSDSFLCRRDPQSQSAVK